MQLAPSKDTPAALTIRPLCSQVQVEGGCIQWGCSFSLQSECQRGSSRASSLSISGLSHALRLRNWGQTGFSHKALKWWHHLQRWEEGRVWDWLNPEPLYLVPASTMKMIEWTVFSKYLGKDRDNGRLDRLLCRNSIVGVIQMRSKCVQATMCNTVTVHCLRPRPSVCHCLTTARNMKIHKGFSKLGELRGWPASIGLSQYGV